VKLQPSAYELPVQALNLRNVNRNINVLKVQMRIKNLIHTCTHQHLQTQHCYLTVFQLYFTTFRIETGYENPIESVEQMLRLDMIDGSLISKRNFYPVYRLVSINNSQRNFRSHP
jgi:hypothetical protein